MSKTKLSNITKKYKTGKIITDLLSFLCMWGPALFWIIYTLAKSGIVIKYSFGASCLAAIILCIISAICKYHWRTPVVILLFGLYGFGYHFAAVLITVGVGIILDELLITPLHKHYREKYSINKEIDKRG